MRHYHYRQPLPVQNKKTRSKRLLIVAIAAFFLGTYALSLVRDRMSASEPQTLAEISVPSRYDLSGVAHTQHGQSAFAAVETTLNIHASDNQLWPMASVTKVVTALAILEKAPMSLGETGDIITLNQQDEDYYWDYAAKLGTLTPVTAGYEMNQYEVLQTMLLASSNNMTDTLVDRYFSSMDDFVQFTNALLESRGYAHTRVADATGFSPQSVSTPTEMVQIGAWALEHPVIAEIVAQSTASPRVAGWIPNYNILIEQDGISGIKPGLTDESGHNLLFSFDARNKDGETITVVAIVMGIFNRSNYITAAQAIVDNARLVVAQQ